MAKLILSNKIRAARGMPIVETTVESSDPAVITTVETPPSVVSKKKSRKCASYAAFQAHVAKVKQSIVKKTDQYSLDEASLRLLEIRTELSDIQRDLTAFADGETNIPKMLESGLSPRVWQVHAQLAMRYRIFERRQLLIKLGGAK